jgi:hypothetical protein
MATTENYRLQSSIYPSHSSYPWRLIRNGLNIEGLCTNIQCEAYNQMVVINLGIGEFDFARIMLARNNKCPKCNTRIHPTKYALIRCQWRYVNHYSVREFPLNTVLDTYELNDLHCEYKILETMPLPQNGRKYLSLPETTCPICLSHMDTKNTHETSHLSCSHVFHRACIDQWLQTNEYMSKRCPMCRIYIAERC